MSDTLDPFGDFTPLGETTKIRVRNLHRAAKERGAIFLGMSVGLFLGSLLGSLYTSGITGFREALVAFLEGGAAGLAVGLVLGLRLGTVTDKRSAGQHGCGIFLSFFLGAGMIGSVIGLMIHTGGIDGGNTGGLIAVGASALSTGVAGGVLCWWLVRLRTRQPSDAAPRTDGDVTPTE